MLGYQWGMQSDVAGAKQYDLPIWQTEHKCGNYPWATPFDASMAPNDQAYAVESWGLIRDWIRAGVTAYSAWNMVLDTVGVGIDSTRVWPQDALLTVDTSAKKLIVTPAYYVFRHVSQFVAPGAKVVATSGGDALAFKNPDGSLVAVMYNAGVRQDDDRRPRRQEAAVRDARQRMGHRGLALIERTTHKGAGPCTGHSKTVIGPTEYAW